MRRRRGRAALVCLAASATWPLAGCGGHGASSPSTPSTASTPPATAARGARGATAAPFTVVADGLDNPRQLSFGSDGALYVAEAGSGGRGGGVCTPDPSTGGRICVGRTGAIARIAHGAVTRVLAGLPSVAVASGMSASGPAGVVAGRGGLVVVTQDTRIDRRGANRFGAGGRLLGHVLVEGAGGRVRVGADLARFEAARNPDRGRGAAAADAIESDPYALAAYRGGYAVADAAGNDVLWVSPSGAVRVLGVLPTRIELGPAGTVGRTAQRVAVQSVPTSVAVGPDGALYVGELTGFPFVAGSARIWRIAPGHAPRVYADGFTNISALAFDRAGRLLVLEINRSGLRAPSAPGVLIRLGPGGRRTELASAGLASPTGLAVGPDGAIYVANHGSSPGKGTGARGQVVRIGAA